MGSRRKAKARREPRFDAFPIPAFNLRLSPRDRPAGAGDDKPSRTSARQPRREPEEEEEEERPARRDKAEAKPASSGRLRLRLGRVVYWGCVLGLWGAIGAVGAVVWFAAHLPPIQSLEVPKRPPAIQILGLNGRTLATRGEMGGAALALKELPAYLSRAFIAIEDRRFYPHRGVDPVGIGRAVVANLLRRNVSQGGSTLTQQLAKNLFLTQARTLDRKIQELVLALWLEHKFTKAEILELYLNRVYFGAGAYGVEAAAQRYFGKSARQVTLAEAAMLAGLVKSPSRLSPSRNPGGAERRAHVVLTAMVEAGFLTDNQAKTAIAQEPRIIKPPAAAAANYIADWVMDVLNDLIGNVEQDIVVETTIEPTLQAAAEKALVDELAQRGDKYSVGQGALISMSPDGAVRALVGGRSYSDSQFNRAIAAKRQPGSAFKPFVYLTALERGFTPDTVREDRPIEIKGWRPENYTRQYFGPVTLTQALAHSLNTVAVRLALEVGPKAIVRTAHRLGIASPLNANASLALGTSEVSMIELVSAFAPFANGGTGVVPYVVERVRTAGGKQLYAYEPQSLGRIVDERHVGMMNAMMRETLVSGTAHKADVAGWPAAGKTGTSQDFRDAWFIGYTAHLVTGVWLGNDDNSPMKRTTGGGLPVDIWSRFMKTAHLGIAVADLPGLRGSVASVPALFPGAAPVAARPPATVQEPGRPRPPEGGGLDGWFIDRLFGRH